MRRSTRSRYTAKDRQMTAYLNLIRAGVPTWVTSDEAFRMTDGRVGTKGDHNGAHGFTLASLVREANGEVHALVEDLEPVPPLKEQGKILRARFLDPQPEDDGTEAESVVEVQAPRSQDYCPRCNRLIALRVDGTFYSHGPRDQRCA